MVLIFQKDTTQAVESMKKGTTEVGLGKKLAQKAGESLEEIIVETEKVSEFVTNFTIASEKQGITSEAINQNISAISAVTQESATATQQIAKTAENLDNLMKNLKDIVNKFIIASNIETRLNKSV